MTKTNLGFTLLYLIEDLPQNDIAEILKISPGTVRSQYFRAKKQIIKHVEKMKNHE